MAAHRDLFETCWHESRGRADWVCLVDLDEILFHPAWYSYLKAQRRAGVTIFQAHGFDMVSERFPEPAACLPSAVPCGTRDFHFDKTLLFCPVAIDSINYTVGRHCSSPAGRIVPPATREIQLRHYKLLGVDHVLTRARAFAARLTEGDRARGWGAHYLRDEEFVRAGFAEQLCQASPVPPPKTKPRKSWW